MSGIPASLELGLREQRIIPFAGAGISRGVLNSSTGGPLFPDWRELLARAADVLVAETRQTAAEAIRQQLASSAADLAQLAGLARKQLKGQWYRLLRDCFAKSRSDAAPDSLEAASLMWNLGSPLVVTTNFDPVLRWVHPLEAELRVWNIEAPIEFRDFQAARASSPGSILWHLHGSMDAPEEIVLTSEEYLGLYTPGEAAHPPASRYPAALLMLSHLMAFNSMLFVGFSLKDPFLNTRLQFVDQIFRHGTQHYAVMLKSDVAKASADLPVTVLELDDFAELPDLLRRLRDIAANGDRLRARQRELAEAAKIAYPRLVKALIELVAAARPQYLRAADELGKMLLAIDAGSLDLSKAFDDVRALTQQLYDEIHHKEELARTEERYLDKKLREAVLVQREATAALKARLDGFHATVLARLEETIARLPDEVADGLAKGGVFLTVERRKAAAAAAEARVHDALFDWGRDFGREAQACLARLVKDLELGAIADGGARVAIAYGDAAVGSLASLEVPLAGEASLLAVVPSAIFFPSAMILMSTTSLLSPERRKSRIRAELAEMLRGEMPAIRARAGDAIKKARAEIETAVRQSVESQWGEAHNLGLAEQSRRQLAGSLAQLALVRERSKELLLELDRARAVGPTDPEVPTQASS